MSLFTQRQHRLVKKLDFTNDNPAVEVIQKASLGQRALTKLIGGARRSAIRQRGFNTARYDSYESPALGKLPRATRDARDLRVADADRAVRGVAGNGQVWVKGFYRNQNGQRVWVPGYYRDPPPAGKGGIKLAQRTPKKNPSEAIGLENRADELRLEAKKAQRGSVNRTQMEAQAKEFDARAKQIRAQANLPQPSTKGITLRQKVPGATQGASAEFPEFRGIDKVKSLARRDESVNKVVTKALGALEDAQLSAPGRPLANYTKAAASLSEADRQFLRAKVADTTDLYFSTMTDGDILRMLLS